MVQAAEAEEGLSRANWVVSIMLDSLLHFIETNTGIPPGQVAVFAVFWVAVMLLFVGHLVRNKFRKAKNPASPAPTTESLALDAAAYELASDAMARRHDEAPAHVKQERKRDLRFAYIGFAFFCVIVVIPYGFLLSSRRSSENAKPKRPPANQSP